MSYIRFFSHWEVDLAACCLEEVWFDSLKARQGVIDQGSRREIKKACSSAISFYRWENWGPEKLSDFPKTSSKVTFGSRFVSALHLESWSHPSLFHNSTKSQSLWRACLWSVVCLWISGEGSWCHFPGIGKCIKTFTTSGLGLTPFGGGDPSPLPT